MEGKKIYLQPRGTVINTILDIVELLRGKSFACDTPNGKINTQLSLYGYRWEVRFFVQDFGCNQCNVTIGIDGQRRDKKREIRSMFALLDSMLLTEAEIKYAEKEADLVCGRQMDSG